MTRLIGNSTLAERELKLKFAENFSSSAAVSENGGTETNSPVTPFLFTGNGTDATYINYVYESEPRQSTDELTVMAWIYPTVAPDGTGRMICADYRYQGVNDEWGWTFGDNYGSDDHLHLSIYSGANRALIGNYGFFANYLNQWTHVAGVFKKNDRMEFYINGVMVSSEADGHPNFQTNGTGLNTSIEYYPGYNLRIGQRSDGSQGKWAGNIKEVKFFNAALDPLEIEKYANNTMYSYRNEAVFDCPLTYAEHDPTNSISLDVSGRDNHLGLIGSIEKNRTTRGYYVDYLGGDYLYKLTDLSITNKDFTMMVWFKVLPSTLLNWNGIFRIGDSDGTLAVQIDTSGSYAARLRARIDTSALLNQHLGEIGELGNDWVMATLTYDIVTQLATLYFNDGKVISTRTVVGTITADNLRINGGAGGFKGDIIYMKLWYQKLSPMQIADQYYTLIKGAINRK